MNPFIALAAQRIGFFVLPLGVLSLLQVSAPYAVGGAAAVSVLLSAIFLRAQRRRVAQRLVQSTDAAISRRHARGDSRARIKGHTRGHTRGHAKSQARDGARDGARRSNPREGH